MLRNLLSLAIFLPILSSAQERKTFKLNPGQKATDVIPANEIYRYPSFVSGTVSFRNDRVGTALMNYNALIAEMQFIDPKGDTLSLDDAASIRSILLQGDTFYFHKVFLHQLATIGDRKLAEHSSFVFVNRQKLGGFGEPTNATVETYNQISTSSFFKDLVARELITLGKVNILYTGDKFNQFREVNRKNLMQIYSRKSKELDAYLRTHDVAFGKVEDVKALMMYMDGL